METTTQFPVNSGTVVEVTCSNSEHVNKGSSELTCKTGKIFTVSEEPSCSIPGLKMLISDEALNTYLTRIIIPGFYMMGHEGTKTICKVFSCPKLNCYISLNFGVQKYGDLSKIFSMIPKFRSSLLCLVMNVNDISKFTLQC